MLKFTLPPDDYKTLANICNRHRFIGYCTEEYNHLRIMDYSEEVAFEYTIQMARRLNQYNHTRDT